MTHAPFDSLSHTLGAHLKQVQAFWVRLVLLLALLALSVSWASAAPRAADAEECFYATDMLLSARAMAAAGLPERKIREVLGAMYAAKHAAKWMDDLVRHALRSDKSAKDAALEFYTSCTERRGNVDGVLGVAL